MNPELSTRADIEVLILNEETRKVMNDAVDQAMHLSEENERLIVELQRERAKNQPLRASRDWHRLGMWIFAVVAVVEAVALYWTH